jgi:hypothetical protein
MTGSHVSLRSTIVVALQQIALAAILFLLAAVWLHVPDANGFEVLASIVLALLIAGVAGAGESFIALRLTHRQPTVHRLALGIGNVLLAALIWFGISAGLDHLSANDGLRAGYLNSRFPASLRNVFSYGHLYLWFGWVWSVLRWIAAGLLAAAAFAFVTCEAPVRGLLAIFRAGAYWLSLLLVVIGAVSTGALLDWTPGHGIRTETLSLVVRLAVAVALNAATIAILLQAMAGAVLRIQSFGTAEPESIQPRTADIP